MHNVDTVSIGMRPPARILLVTHGYPPNQTGGAEVQAQRKARWWSQRGDNVRVLAADTSPDNAPAFGVIDRSEDTDGDVSICRLRFRAPDGTRPFSETFDHQLLAPEIAREMAAFMPDLVYQVSGYLFGLIPLRMAAEYQIPSALFAMDFWHMCPRITLLRPDGACCLGPRHPADCAACRFADRQRVQRVPVVAKTAWSTLARAGRVPGLAQGLDIATFAERESAVRETLARVSLVVANSRFLADRLRSMGVPEDRLLTVRQGLEQTDIACRESGRRADGSLRVLFLGQITWHKGVDLAVQAVSDLADRGRDIMLRVHGQPTGGATYRARLAERGASSAIEFGEPLGRDAIMRALQDSDVLVVPSRWYENSPNVILEAFSAGVPVVVADHGGMAEMVRDGIDGLRFAAGDATSLAEVLRRLCDESGLLDQLRKGITSPTSVDEEMCAEESALIRVLRIKA